MATTFPVTIAPEAAARVAELRMQREFEQMVQFTLETTPCLQSIEVSLAPAYDTGDDPQVSIEAITNASPSLTFPAEDRLGNWRMATFPPEVWSRFSLSIVPGNNQ